MFYGSIRALGSIESYGSMSSIWAIDFYGSMVLFGPLVLFVSTGELRCLNGEKRIGDSGILFSERSKRTDASGILFSGGVREQVGGRGSLPFAI